MGGHINYVMTLANSIIGVGVLAMPFCFQKCGIILAIVMILLSSIISRLSCHFLLKASIYSRRKNFEFLAFHALGSTGKLLVELGIIGFLMGTVIAFFVVVGDLGPEIIAKALNIESSKSLRSWLLIIITIGCVIPLGLLRNVDSLTSICTVTIGFYICLVIKVMVESTKHIANSDWIDKVELWQPAGILQCLPIFSMALFCQTQIFEIYSRMENASLEKMNLVVKWAINICAMVYILVGSFGYIAFCHQHFGGNILLSFSPTPMSDIIKMGFVLSVAFSFPLAIFPCRASLYSLLFRRVISQHEVIPIVMPERRFRCLTILIVAVGLIVAMALPSIELVLGLVGSTMGVAVCVLLPAACYVKVVTKNNNERLLAQIVLFTGILIMVFGTYANLYAMDEAKSTDNMVNNEILLIPLDEAEIKLLDKKTLEKKSDVINNINNNEKAPANNDLLKGPLIDSPPLPVEKDELANVEKFIKTQNIDIPKKQDLKLAEDMKIVQQIEIKDSLKNVNIEQSMKIKNEKVPEEISDDAIKKEDNELELEKNSQNIPKSAEPVNIDSDLKPTKEEKIKVSMNKNQDSLKIESNTEVIAIEKIQKEKQQLDDEFERKVVKSGNLLSNMNIKRLEKVGKIYEKEEMINKESIKELEKTNIDKTVNLIQNEKKSDLKFENTSQKKNEELVKNFETISKAVPVASHIKRNEKEPKKNEITKQDVKYSENNALKNVQKPPILLLINKTKPSDEIQDKFVHRGMLQLDTSSKYNRDRLKRDTNRDDENCSKNENNNNLGDINVKIPVKDYELNQDSLLKNSLSLEILKPSIRDLKSFQELKDSKFQK